LTARQILTEVLPLYQLFNTGNVEYNKYQFIQICLYAIQLKQQNMGKLPICVEVSLTRFSTYSYVGAGGNLVYLKELPTK